MLPANQARARGKRHAHHITGDQMHSSAWSRRPEGISLVIFITRWSELLPRGCSVNDADGNQLLGGQKFRCFRTLGPNRPTD
jgi:hypothetical protein